MINDFKSKSSKKTGLKQISDLPDLPVKIVKESFNILTYYDTVLGPCKDGGYYLIGFRNDTFLPSVFENIPWSMPSVFNFTMGVLRKCNYKVGLLPEWSDIDTFEDVKRLIRRSRSEPVTHRRTMEVLKTLGLIGMET